MLALALASGCTSDEPLDSTTGIDLTTGSHTSEINVFTTGEPEYSTSTGEPETEQTCRMAISCLVNCALDLSNPGPEEDLSCFRGCVKGMSTAEWLALFDLMVCVTERCYEKMECTDHGENDDDICRGCIFGGLAADEPMGCEVEGQACE